MPKAGVSHAQALGSPVAAGQGRSSTGMWGAACSGAASWGADPRAKGSRELPPSLLCGCWAQPLGLVKQQDRSRLGERGTGESLNKRVFNLEDSWASGSLLAFPVHAAVPGSAPSPLSQLGSPHLL